MNHGSSIVSLPLLRRFFPLAGLFCCLAGPVADRLRAELGETWEWRNPLPQGSGIKAMTEAGGKLIAVGRGGTVLTTTGGMNWTQQVPATRNHLRAVAASGATVVAVGREGDIVTSTDGGLTWALRSSSATEWITVVQGGGVWVTAGAPPADGNNTMMTSPDALTWTAVAVPNSSSTYFNCSVWIGTRFVLGGSIFGTAFTVLATSENGLTWTPRTAGSLSEVNGLAWTGSRVVAAGWGGLQNGGGDISFSPDGLTWTDALTPTPASAFGGVVWTGTQVFAWPVYSSQAVYTSPTGETWTPRGVLSTIPSTFFVAAAAGSGSTLFAAADAGVLRHSPDGGATWNPVSSGVAANFNALTRFAGRWVAAGGDGNLTSSADGLTWTPASSGTNSRLRAIAWHDGLWVAGGREEVTPPGLAARRKFSLFTSPDGVTWTDRSFGNGTSDWRQIYSIIRAGSQWVATATDAVLTSPDGITWQERPVGLENRAVAWNGSRLIAAGGLEDEDDDPEGEVYLSDDDGVTWNKQRITDTFVRGIAWTGSQFVIVGDAGLVYTSPQGNAGTWTFRPGATTRDLRCVLADNGGLVAVGGNYSFGPVILTSPDGVTWSPRNVPGTRVLYSVIKAGGLYVATGYDGLVLTSPDAVTWTEHQTNTTHELYAAAWDGTQLLASGEGGAILASTAGNTTVAWKSIVQRPGPGLTLRLTWPAVSARVYDIESTTVLAPPWLPIPGSPRTATSAEEFIDFTEPAPSANSRRFFRVQERQP